ncbi:MAG: ECF transporter S component [Promethearchaeota archaeon]
MTFWRLDERVEKVKSRLDDVQVMKEIALIVVFTTMVFLSTSLFYVALPATNGFFNIGEAFVYLSALIGGPIVGMIAGGLGSAMADMLLGYGFYAPGTLVLKGAEGLAAGILYRFTQRVDQRVRVMFLAIITFFLLGFTIFITTPVLNGIPGSEIIEIGFNIQDVPIISPLISLILGGQDHFIIPGIILVIAALILSAILWYVGYFMGEKGQMALSCVLAGSIIVIGYFAYQLLVLVHIFEDITFVKAVTEVPFNILQVAIGTVIAVPIVSYLRELGILSEPENNARDEFKDQKDSS